MIQNMSRVRTTPTILTALSDYNDAPARAAAAHAVADAALAVAPKMALIAVDTALLDIASDMLLKSSNAEYVIDLTLAKDHHVALAELQTAASASPLDFNHLALAVKVAHASTSAALAALP